MNEFAVVADDLTGANENGIHFFLKGQGFRTVIYDTNSILPDLRRAAAGKNIVAVDTESRQEPPERAAALVRSAVKALLKYGAEKTFLKLDSTLRGNIAVSIKAAFSEIRPPFAAVCFAYPEFGRTTKNGIHYVNGIPASRTAFAADPLNPVASSEIQEILRSTGQKSGLVGLKHIRSGSKSVKLEIKRLCGTGVTLLVFDCVSGKDLKIIAAALSGCRLFAGASALAGELCPGKETAQRKPVIRAGRVAGIIGSMNPVTREQLKRLVLLERVKCIFSTPDDALTAGISANLGAKDFIVVLDDGRRSREQVENLVKERGPAFAAEKISAGLAKIAKKCGADPDKDAMFFSGGATAAGACRCFGMRAFSMKGFAEPGIPVMRSEEFGTPVITKSGGFGNKDALVRIYRMLKGKD